MLTQNNLTMDEIREMILKRYDPDDLIDYLELTSEEILDRFEDKLINRLEMFEEELQDDTRPDTDEEDEH
jgi:hypothetical protein|tara:strand:- start:450 stop:659 length:210 start_codon:yes stop_codon:yes gene_type:complete